MHRSLSHFRTWLVAASLGSLGVFSVSGCSSNAMPSMAGRTFASDRAAHGVSYSVTNLNDSGSGSLRAAIVAANTAATPGVASITFAVNGTISLASALPEVTAKVKIDGTTAPTYAGNPVVEIDASRHAGMVFGRGSAGSWLVGIAVIDATGNGIVLNAGDMLLNHDYVGVNIAGERAANTGDGISVSATSSNNQIGKNPKGVEGAVGNVISGNGGNGLSLHGSSGNVIAANRIGTNITGTSAMANGGNGIWMTGGSQQNEIGGKRFIDSTGQVNNPTGSKGQVMAVFVIPPEGNLVSGNRRNGILIDDGSTNNTLNGNFVGTTADGDGIIANKGDGVMISAADDNSLVGCKFRNNPFVYYNVVSGNEGNGLEISSANNIVVQGNFFGVGANNTNFVPNKGDGILVDGSSQGTVVGGVIPLGNVSAANGANGIEVKDTASGFTTFNTFGGLLAFKGRAPNANDGLLVTSTGGNQTVRTNVFSGNLNNGIEIAGDASGVTVDPDIVGLTTTGSGKLPNGGDGVHIGGSAHDNVIGGYTQSVIPQNTFGGNRGYGIAIVDVAHENQVINSDVGTNAVGTMREGNDHGGILIGGTANHNTIGGVSSDASKSKKNIVSGNIGNGVTLDKGSSYTQVIDNWIGLDRFGKKTLPNTGHPIVVQPGSKHNTIKGNVTS
jgi:parallel beta-helix repeat protein